MVMVTAENTNTVFKIDERGKVSMWVNDVRVMGVSGVTMEAEGGTRGTITVTMPLGCVRVENVVNQRPGWIEWNAPWKPEELVMSDFVQLEYRDGTYNAYPSFNVNWDRVKRYRRITR